MQRSQTSGVSNPSSSPVAEWWRSLIEPWGDIATYLRERRRLLDDPAAIFDRERKPKLSPSRFALQGTVFLACVFSLLDWGIEHFGSLPPSPYERAISELEQARAQGTWFSIMSQSDVQIEQLKTEHKLNEFFASIENIFVAASILMAATVFRWILRRWRAHYPTTNHANIAHLYCISAVLFWPNLAFTISSKAIDMYAHFEPIELYELNGYKLFLQAAIGIWGVILLRRGARILSQALRVPSRWAAIANRLVVAQALSLGLVSIFMAVVARSYLELTTQ